MRRLAFILALCLTPTTFADVVYLTDGRTLEGDVKKTPDGWTVDTGHGAEPVVLGAEQVKSISVGNGTPSDSDAAGLASLRRSVAALADPRQAIAKYKRFIATADGPEAALAEADLVVWQDRADRKLVKFGGDWLTPEAADAAKAKFGDQLIDARAKALDGRTKEAKAIVDLVLSGNPDEPAALYLKGVLAFADNDIPTARKCFDDAADVVPKDGPTLNNLAVVMMRQNQSAAALNAYVRAMNASPGDPRILDNAAEALNTLSADPKLATAVKKATAVFSPLDVALAARMAQDGYFRWGATWVTKDEIDRLTALEKQIDDQLVQLDSDFRAAQAKIQQYQDDIDDNERSMRRMEADSNYFDQVTRRYVRTALPAVYYQMQRDNQELIVRQRREQERMAQLRAEAKAVRAKKPAPRFTGAQRLIGPEGTPNLLPLTMPEPKTATPAAATTTQPTAPPANVPPNPGPPPRSQVP